MQQMLICKICIRSLIHAVLRPVCKLVVAKIFLRMVCKRYVSQCNDKVV